MRGNINDRDLQSAGADFEKASSSMSIHEFEK